MRKYGLIGYPLSHSFSKKYFTEKFAKEGINDCGYELYQIQTINSLPELIKENNLHGLNVTIPYKKEVLPFLTNMSAAVSEMQACNCILIKDGQTIGYNTDVVGFEKTFSPQLQSHHNKALVLGTGGASAAVVFTLEKLGIDYMLVSRHNNYIANCITYDLLTQELMAEFSIVINTTPVGTWPNVNDCPAIPYEFLTKQHYLYDLVYNPAETMFLKKGKESGAVTQNGEQMLIIQAEESWKIWNQL